MIMLKMLCLQLGIRLGKLWNQVENLGGLHQLKLKPNEKVSYRFKTKLLSTFRNETTNLKMIFDLQYQK
jgi:hypothetical protein